MYSTPNRSTPNKQYSESSVWLDLHRGRQASFGQILGQHSRGAVGCKPGFIAHAGQYLAPQTHCLHGQECEGAVSAMTHYICKIGWSLVCWGCRRHVGFGASAYHVNNTIFIWMFQCWTIWQAYICVCALTIWIVSETLLCGSVGTWPLLCIKIYFYIYWIMKYVLFTLLCRNYLPKVNLHTNVCKFIGLINHQCHSMSLM